MQNRLTRRTRAFTLVEILIVVIILGILASIVIPQFTNASTQARDEAFKANLRDLVGIATLYHQKYGVLPAQGAGDTIPQEMLAAANRREFPLKPPSAGSGTSATSPATAGAWVCGGPPTRPTFRARPTRSTATSTTATGEAVASSSTARCSVTIG